MVAVSGYKFLNVITPFPEGSGGQILNTNFQTVADLLESGVIHDATRGFTQPISGVLPVNGYELARLADITAQQVGSGLPYWNTARLQNIYIGTFSPPSGSLIKYDGSQWQPSGTSLVFLSDVFADKTPQLGGPLDLTYSSVIYNYAGSGIILGGSGLFLEGTQLSKPYYFYSQGWGGNLEPSSKNIDLQFIDGTYSSGVYIAKLRNTIIGGYRNKICFPEYTTIGQDYYDRLDYNVIVGGYDNFIVISGYNPDRLFVSQGNVILGGNNNIVLGGEGRALLGATNVTISGYEATDQYFYLTGNSPLATAPKMLSHGIKNLDSVVGGFNKTEFFLWGSNPNSYSMSSQDSGVIVDFFGSRRGLDFADRFYPVGGMPNNIVSSYELFCVISAKDQVGEVHTAAWSPIHLKMFKEGQWMNILGDLQWENYPYVTQSGGKFVPSNYDYANYTTNSLKESGDYQLDNTFVYWYPSKYNNGMSGLCTIYMEEDDNLFEYNYNYFEWDETLFPYFTRVNEYTVVRNAGTSYWYDPHYTYHTGPRLIIQFRLHDYGWSGLRASVWARGMEMKNRIPIGTVVY